ncbi:MAG: TIGR01777 family oxidoreductase [Saprospiraceae bacterium]
MGIVLIAGGTGMIGQHWIRTQGDQFSEIRLLSRKAGQDGKIRRYAWDPAAGTYDPDAFRGIDFVINLAGAGIADKPWTPDRKQLIVDSRRQSVETLQTALRQTGATPRMILAASATGYYGDRQDVWVDEASAAGPESEFLSATTRIWEEASQGLAEAGYPLAILRIGIVLSREGGALPKLLLPMKAGMANYFGDGRQYMPWIHIDDLCNQMTWILKGERKGIWNGVAPMPVTSREMADAIRRVYGGWLTMPVPTLALQALLGEMSDTVLTGARVSAQKAVESGMTFQYPKLDEALLDLKSE